VGKPSRSFFQTVIDNFQSGELDNNTGENGSCIAVIGDDIEADLGEGALELGLWRILGNAFLLSYSVTTTDNRRQSRLGSTGLEMNIDQV
jgi:hypothetical protein